MATHPIRVARAKRIVKTVPRGPWRSGEGTPVKPHYGLPWCWLPPAKAHLATSKDKPHVCTTCERVWVVTNWGHGIFWYSDGTRKKR
jgi:hypothetical protein